eukprot:3548746-Rhodomonas_salina.4
MPAVKTMIPSMRTDVTEVSGEAGRKSRPEESSTCADTPSHTHTDAHISRTMRRGRQGGREPQRHKTNLTHRAHSPAVDYASSSSHQICCVN